MCACTTGRHTRSRAAAAAFHRWSRLRSEDTEEEDIFDAKSDTDRDLRAELNTLIQQLYHSQLNPSATGAAARQTTDIARVELLDRCPRSQRLSFFAEELHRQQSPAIIFLDPRDVWHSDLSGAVPYVC